MRRLLLSVAVLGMLAALAFGATTVSAAPTLAYDSIPSPLPPNVPSLGYQANQTAEFGDDVQLAGANRYISSVTVTMSDWAKKSDYPSVGTASSWTHPITLNIYNVNTSGANPALGSLITTTTQTQTIPWRPEADPTCPGGTAWRAADTFCYNGFAFNVTFTLPHAIYAPSRVIVGIAYNTNTWGASPIGAPGPYESLNVGLNTGAPSVGADSDSDAVFWNTQTASNYADGGTGGVGTFRRDTNWTPYSPAFQVNTEAGCTTTCYVDAATGNDSFTGATASDAKKTIQAGVDAVSTGGTVIVAAGTYTNAAVDKSLTLEGAKAGVDARTRSGSESIVQSISITANDVTVDGFSFNGSGVQLNVSSATILSGVVIKNDILTGYGDVGIPTYNAGNILITKSLFNGSPSSGESIQIKADGTPTAGGCTGSQVIDNKFVDATNNGGADVNFSCTGSNSSNVKVAGNNSTGNTGDSSFTAFSGVNNGIEVSGNTANTTGSTVFFFGNVSGSALITDNVFTSAGSAVSIHGGDFTSDLPNSGTFTVTGNNLSGSNRGIFAGAGMLTGGLIANRNDLSGEATAGVDNQSSVTADATCNWWGNAAGPGSAGASILSGSANAVPWLLSNNLNGDCNAVIVHGSGAADASGSEGTTISTNGSFDGSISSITADNAFGTFTPNAAAGTWTWSYVAPDQFGPTVITVTAHGTNGSTASDPFNASATNANPTATLSAPASVLFNSTFTVSLTGGSDVAADTLSYSFDCGSGSFGAASASSSTTCTAPSTAGPITVQGRILDEDGGFNTYSTTVTITRQDVSLSPGSRDFGPQLINTSSAPFLFIIKNIGSANLVLGPVSIGGTNSNQFGIADPNNCGGTTLAPNATCNVNVFFHPTSAGGKTGSLVVASNDPDSPSLTATLTGSGASASQGTITIKLDAHPDGAQAFKFKGSPGIGNFTLTDNGTAANSATFNVGGGDYKFQMTKQAGWAIASITCDTSAVVKPNKRKVTAHVVIGQNATCTFTVTQRKPDSAIATSQAGPYAGVGTISSTVQASQTVNQAVAAGQTRSLFATFTNSGLDSDSFKIDANLVGSGKFKVSFFVGTTNVTQQVLAGTYSVTLVPGAQLSLEIRVTAKSNTGASATRNIDLTMSSKTATAAKDVVRAHVTRA